MKEEKKLSNQNKKITKKSYNNNIKKIQKKFKKCI